MRRVQAFRAPLAGEDDKESNLEGGVRCSWAHARHAVLHPDRQHHIALLKVEKIDVYKRGDIINADTRMLEAEHSQCALMPSCAIPLHVIAKWAERRLLFQALRPLKVCRVDRLAPTPAPFPTCRMPRKRMNTTRSKETKQECPPRAAAHDCVQPL